MAPVQDGVFQTAVGTLGFQEPGCFLVPRI